MDHASIARIQVKDMMRMEISNIKTPNLDY